MKTNIVYADLSEILFEGRNKSYGGYFLRKTANANLVKGLLTTVSACLLLFLMMRSSGPADEIFAIDNFAKTIEYREIVLPVTPKVEENTTPPSSPNDPPPAAPSSEFLTPDPVPDDQANNNTMNANDSIKNNPGTTEVPGGTGTGLGPENGTGPPTSPPLPPTEDNTIYGSANSLSSKPFATNMDEMRRCIQFPSELKRMGMGGKVMLKLLLDKEGKVEEIKVAQTTHPLFSEACKTCMTKLKFEPGKMGDLPVKVWVTIPFIFTAPN